MNIEYLEYKKSITEKIRFDLELNVLSKLKKSSKAYEEIVSFIDSLKKEKVKISAEIKYLKENDKDKYSTIKIKTKTLNEIIELKNDLSLEFISETIEVFTSTFREYFLLDKLEKVIPIEINVNTKKKLSNTNFYVCKVENKKEIIAYKIEDLVIYESNEFLDINNFRVFNLLSNSFLFSPKYTLQDIDEFIKLWLD